MQEEEEIQAQEEDEEVQMKPESHSQSHHSNAETIQSKGKESKSLPVNLPELLAQSKGKGAPLPPDVQKEMEAHFGADFSQVRIHTGEEAIAMTKMLNAQAFTNGCDIYFNEGKYDPSSKKGKELLAHELTHVVQQKGKKNK